MVVSTRKNKPKTPTNQGKEKYSPKAIKISSSTQYDLCEERLTAFGGLLSLVKIMDILKVEEIFKTHFTEPSRQITLGYYKMFYGLLMLLFIGFQRVGHFEYIRKDVMICGILNVTSLPVVSTFWRFVQSLGINQSRSILQIMGEMRQRIWKICNLTYKRIHIDIDTTVATVYGNIEGSRKGHNTKHRGKKGLRPILAFIQETREYLVGWQRRGQTVSAREITRLIRELGFYLPPSISEVVIRADGEFISWEAVSACIENGYGFIFAVKRCAAKFKARKWYRYKEYEYNECVYKPHGWEQECRFVTMRITKAQLGDRQLELFEEDSYAYRTFVTSLSCKPHTVISEYDQRANIENSIKEAQHEGILAIPSKRFACNHAFFQIVMCAFNLWRWMQLIAANRICISKGNMEQEQQKDIKRSFVDSTIRIARLKMLFIAAKIVTHSEIPKVRYSVHDMRSSEITGFLDYIDKKKDEFISRYKKAA